MFNYVQWNIQIRFTEKKVVTNIYDGKLFSDRELYAICVGGFESHILQDAFSTNEFTL